MILRAALAAVCLALLAGCVSEGGKPDPLKSTEGREQAVDAYIELGMGYLRSGRAERAKAPLQKALELDPSSADANAALGMVFQREMEAELAEKHYKRALSQSPDDSGIRNNYASFLYEQQRYPEAYEVLQQAASDEMYGDRSRVFANMGLTAQKLNKPELAKEHFEKSLRLNPRQPMVLLELAQINYDNKMYGPARGYYERYRPLVNEQGPRGLLLGVRLAKVLNDRDSAATYALQLKQLYPGSPEYRQLQSEQ